VEHSAVRDESKCGLLTFALSCHKRPLPLVRWYHRTIDLLSPLGYGMQVFRAFVYLPACEKESAETHVLVCAGELCVAAVSSVDFRCFS
jgi:hypothetical protein